MWFRSTHCLAIGVSTSLLVMVLAPFADGQRRTTTQDQAIPGRWDLTLESGAEKYPSWLEVRLSGRRTLVGSFVGRFGSARPISRVEFVDGQVRFSVPPQWEQREDDQRFEGRLQDGLLKGETTDEHGRKVIWTGRRAPALERTGAPVWKEPVELFNSKDLAGWKPRLAVVKNGWIVRDGLLVNATPGNDLVSAQRFTDFKLHAEFRYPKGSNSGIYLRGRYEMQIEDDYGDEPDSHKIGGIYGFLTPSVNAARKPGEWQSADVTLLGRVVTIVLNGERIIDRQTIPGITGGALDSDEAAPGPIMLQGDHGAIEFRRVTVTPASVDGREPLHLHLRSRANGKGEGSTVMEKTADWDPKKTALIICDMWDDHWCKSAARRVAEMAGPLNDTVKAARARGVFIIHAPSSVTNFYKDTPQRRRAQQAPFARPPVPLSTSERWGTTWCWPDPQREAALPIDDSDMGCACAEKCTIREAWKRQIASIEIAEEDAITDNGQETWNLLQARGIDNVILCGVHLNMCVLGRPFGIRQQVHLGKNVALLRDLTDTMYNPDKPPRVSHFAGTALVIEHVERYWCPSFTSSDITGKPAFRFAGAN